MQSILVNSKIWNLEPQSPKGGISISHSNLNANPAGKGWGQFSAISYYSFLLSNNHSGGRCGVFHCLIEGATGDLNTYYWLCFWKLSLISAVSGAAVGTTGPVPWFAWHLLNKATWNSMQSLQPELTAQLCLLSIDMALLWLCLGRKKNICLPYFKTIHNGW